MIRAGGICEIGVGLSADRANAWPSTGGCRAVKRDAYEVKVFRHQGSNGQGGARGALDHRCLYE